MWCAALLLLAAAENLLENPGFEEQDNGSPRAWDAFVEPAEGARARLDRPGRSGEAAAQLTIGQPYPREPFNNWSQNVFGAWADQSLEISGWIRTEDAGEAALWVQCWRQRPAEVLLVASTARNTPVRGTQDWQEVRAAFTPPAGTDFLTVRCVLKGTGRAWFDDVRLEVTSVTAPATPPGTAEDTPAANKAPESPAPPPAPAPPHTPAPVTAPEDALETALRGLRRDNSALRETLDAVRAQNEELRETLELLRAELDQMRQQLEESQAPVAAEPVRPALVPRGEDPARYR